MKSILVVLLLGVSNVSLAERASKEELEKSIFDAGSYEFTPKLGVSPFVGVLGLEAKYKKIALSIGFPTTVSVKYYQNPDDDSWYVGAFNSSFKNSEFDDYEDGIYFDEYERKFYGVGFGYMWLWQSQWNLSLGLGYGPSERKYKNSRILMVKETEYISLELNVGYRF